MIIRKDTAVRLPVRLITSANVAVTGMLPANLTNGTTTGHATIVKGNSTVADITLTNGVNFFEINATSCPGLYHILVPASATNVEGGLQLVVLPAATAFLSTVITAQVDTLLANAELAAKMLRNRAQIFATGADANRQVFYDDDGVTSIWKFDLLDVDGNPTTINPFTRVPV